MGLGAGAHLEVGELGQLGGVVLEGGRLVVLLRDAAPIVCYLYQLAATLLEPHLRARASAVHGRKRHAMFDILDPKCQVLQSSAGRESRYRGQRGTQPPCQTMPAHLNGCGAGIQCVLHQLLHRQRVPAAWK